ncbi:hypothetical protein ACLOJK_017512 [Asimina triloba]
MAAFAVEVESEREGRDGQPAVGPIYRNPLSKDGFPPLEPDMTTSWDVFSVAAKKHAGNKMLGWREFVDGKAGPYQWKTYREIYEEVLLVGSALRAVGAQPGSRIGIYGSNCPQWIVAMQILVHSRAGAVNFIIQHADIDHVFVQDKKVKEEQKDVADSFGTKAYSWNEFLQIGKENPAELLPPQPSDTCTIMYTSGTSGDPKGVVLTHENHATYVRGVDLYMEQFEDKMTSEDVFLSFLPLAHILDRMIEEYFFHKGASVGYYQGDINALRDDLMELKPTFFAGVPKVFERVHEGLDILLEPFRIVSGRLGGRIRLMVSGGAPLSNEVEEFMRITCCAFFTQGYGLTETCGLTTVAFPDEISMMGTVGVPSVYSEVRLEEVPEMGYSPLADPPRGEICARGKTVFSGYYKNPELTKEVIKDGWFHTGDIGEINSEGILKIIDRKKNIFKLSQGEYVAAEYLEKTYGSTPIIWVYGDSFRSALVAVVVPQADNTKKWADMNGYTASLSELCSFEQLRNYVLSDLESTAERNKVKHGITGHLPGLHLQKLTYTPRPSYNLVQP